MRAYAADADEADVAFAGRLLLISGDVVAVDSAGQRLMLTTGSSVERLAATLVGRPAAIVPHDLIALHCDRINRQGSQPRVSGCSVTAIVPARIANGG